MSKEPIRNIPASIRQRLLDRSRRDSRPFNEMLQYFAMERFLFRLSRSPHVSRFILKGAMVLNVWGLDETRSTMDIDLLGKIDNIEVVIQDTIRNILAIPSPEDGIVFFPDTISTSRINEDADYHGIRVVFRAELDSARINMKLDIGFGDIVYPQPERLPFPTILPLPAPELLCYSRESAIAEKFQAMVKLGSLNSRMKDFFDIWSLSRQFDFDARTLGKAISLTFEKRTTNLSGLPLFSQGFALDKQAQWKAFRSRMKLDHAPESFIEVISQLETFLGPFAENDRTSRKSAALWNTPGPWKE
jgi:hypothetical protein